MTDSAEQTAVIMALHELHTNHSRQFETLDTINPVTGEFALAAKTVILAVGKLHEIPASLADELFAIAAKQEAVGASPCVRHPDERELLSFRHSRGDFNAQA